MLLGNHEPEMASNSQKPVIYAEEIYMQDYRVGGRGVSRNRWDGGVSQLFFKKCHFLESNSLNFFLFLPFPPLYPFLYLFILLFQIMKGNYP